MAAIGGEPAGDRDAAYAPIASNDGPLVHTGDPHQVMPPIVLAHERDGATSAGHAAPASTAEGAANAAPARAVTAHGVPAQELAAASPTPPARLSLGAALGARAGTPFLDGVSIAHEDEVEFTAVTGRVESIVGQLLTVQTAAGPSRVNLADGVRVDRDARGSAADLKPGQFVGVTHPPSGPASSVRLYATEPGMPRPGVVPQVGAWQGQVTTFGSVVALRPGGLLLNAGSQTASIELPSTVEILKPAPSVPADLGVGMQIMATGPVTGDGIVAATAVRVTVPGAPGR